MKIGKTSLVARYVCTYFDVWSPTFFPSITKREMMILNTNTSSKCKQRQTAKKRNHTFAILLLSLTFVHDFGFAHMHKILNILRSIFYDCFFSLNLDFHSVFDWLVANIIKIEETKGTQINKPRNVFAFYEWRAPNRMCGWAYKYLKFDLNVCNLFWF